MKTVMNNWYSFLLICLATVFAVTACSTTGMQRSQDVQSSMKTVDNDIKRIIVQIDAIGNSLDELTKPGQTDLKRAFDLFSDNATKIKTMEKNFAEHADEMEARGMNILLYGIAINRIMIILKSRDRVRSGVLSLQKPTIRLLKIMWA